MDEFFDWLAEVLSPFTWHRIATSLRKDLADWCDIRVTSPLAVLAGLNCVAGLILMRAQSGAAFKLSDTRLCVAAGAAASLAIASRWALSNCQRIEPAFWIKTLLATFSALPLVALFTVATPRNSLLAVSFVSALAVVAANGNLFWKRKSRSTVAEPDRTWDFRRDVSVIGRPSIATPPPVSELTVRSDRRDPDEQPRPAEWCERTTDEFGNAVVRGTILARFESGQSLATAHIPFQPPFDRMPEFSYEAIDDPAIRARAPAVFRYGARLELKRNGDIDTPVQVPVQFRAVAHARTVRAA